MKKLGLLSKTYLAVVFFILYAPIFYLIYYSFNSGGGMSGFESFTLDYYKDLAENTRLIIIVINTLIIALLSAVISTVLGVFGALAIMEVKRNRFKNILLTLNNVLIVSPDVIIGASFLIMFTMIGVKLGFTSVLLSHVAFCTPIVVIMVLPKLQEMSPSLVDAACDLGATKRDVLMKVIIPYITPGIFAGFFLALTYSLDDFAVTFFVTGNGFSTLAVEIYSMARMGISLEINALTTIIFILTVVVVLSVYFLTRGKKKSGGMVKS